MAVIKTDDICHIARLISSVRKMPVLFLVLHVIIIMKGAVAHQVFNISIRLTLLHKLFIMYPGIATRKEVSARPVTAARFREKESGQGGSALIPAANISEFPSEYCIQIAAPGLQNEDFSIELKQGVIAITVQKTTETPGFINNRCEFDYHDWTRAFILPEDADAILTNATYNNGELSIRIPRSNSAENMASVAVYVY